MSLADQSQMWYPTSVQVTVHQARNLRIKGKNGTNDAYAIMQVAKDKFSTSVAEKTVSPVWKEEATFDLPLFHHGNVERCTLYIIVNHRASVGLDKLLGQAVINLVELHEKKTRNKSEWFKLLDKNGKADKDRGQVLLDIQFMRNNMTASMFDLSSQDKPRSRIGKLKDKIRGKKKDGFSDSASAIVPSVSQVLTDSEGEGDANAGPHGAKKKSKLKSLFAPKSNLHRNVSQSMSTLGTLPEKSSTLSGSRSSGLNIDSPELKKKFKFLTHKRTGSTDSKSSQGPFSLLSRSKQNIADQNSLCINGSHVYTEEPEGRMSKGSSTLSLHSSGHGSVEDLRRTHARNDSDISVDSLKGLSVPSYRSDLRERALLQQTEEDERRLADERRQAEARRLQEEQEKRRLEEARLAEEQRLEEEARKEEALRKQEEARKAEEQKQPEEVSVGDRLSSLFGIIRKKEEKKEEEEEKPKPAPSASGVLPSSSNPFEEIPLSSGNSFEETPAEPQRGMHSLQSPSSGFPSRNAKVSAVKPRFVGPEKSSSPSANTEFFTEPPSPPSPSSVTSSISSISSNAPDMFSNMHNSMAPPQVRKSSTDLLSTSNDNLAPATNRHALLPPNYQNSVGNGSPSTPAQAKTLNPLPMQAKAAPRSLHSQKDKGPPLPLPDYDTLYPKRIHGVQGQMKWDHIVAEVTQRQRDYPPELSGKEMSVDRPSRHQDFQGPTPSDTSALPGKTDRNLSQESEEEPPTAWKRMGSGTKFAFKPPNRTTAAPERLSKDVGMKQGSRTEQVPPAIGKPNDLFSSRVLGATATPKVQNSNAPQVRPRSFVADEKKVMNTSVKSGRDALPKESQCSPEREGRNSISAGGALESSDNQAKKVPSIPPRQRSFNRNSDGEMFTSEQPQTAVGTVLESSNMLKQGGLEKPSEPIPAVDKIEDDPFPSQVILAKDPWALPEQQFEGDDLFTGGPKREVAPDETGMTTDDMEKLFGQKDERDPFSYFDHSEPVAKFPEQDETKENGSAKPSPGVQRTLSSRKSRAPLPPGKSDNAGGAVDPFSYSSFLSITSSLASTKPQKAMEGDAAPQPSGVSEGKAPQRAWVSPSDAQSSSGGKAVGKGGEPAPTPRRPHPVKPLNALENQTPTGTSVGRDIKSAVIRENVSEKIKVSGSVGSGPYSQLTPDELISLVVKQQDELSKKDEKILELEDYIDNLLVHVMDEKPSILLAMSNAKKAV